MQNEPQVPSPATKQELEIPFPLARQLFEFAKNAGLQSDSYGQYVREIKAGEHNPNAIPLPVEFSSLVAGQPGQYYLVAYEERTGDYYSKGTRFKTVVISNAEFRGQTNQRIREISVKEPDPSEGKGNVLYISVSERVNEQDLQKLNTTIEEQANLPHGYVEIKYEVKMDGSKRQIGFVADRLDEDFFEWHAEQKQVRWLRKLEIEKEKQTPTTYYRDTYLIGLKPEGGSEELVDIEFKIAGSIISPDSIQIDIGHGPEKTAQILFEDENKKIKILFHQPYINGSNPLEVLRLEPNYQFLFEDPVDVDTLLQTLKLKIRGLENDWDKPQTIFSSPKELTQTPSQIEKK